MISFYFLRFEHVDNLGVYSIPSETGLVIPSVYNNYLSHRPRDAKERPPRHRAADNVPGWTILFHGCWLRTAGRLNAVCNTASSVNKASDGKLRSAVYVQTTQVTRYVGRDETCDSTVFQVDTGSPIGGYVRTQKYC